METPISALHARLAALPLWRGPISLEPLPGGLTNRNFLLASPEGHFVVRLAGDSRVHGIDRLAEQAATAAAAEIGLSPPLVWTEPDLMILRHVQGRALGPLDFERDDVLEDVIALLRRVRDVMPAAYRGPGHDRRLSSLLRRYQGQLLSCPNRWRGRAEALGPTLDRLDAVLATVPDGFAHNDLHGGNLISCGAKLWLIDWEYAGQGQPLADLASLANNALLGEKRAGRCLELWLNRKPARRDRDDFRVMRLAAAIRDLFWGYAQDVFIETDPAVLAGYIAINAERVAARL